ncbi:hypothetical protein CUD01_26830 [Cellulomonas uda]|uniref:Uncharacterized protein n=1 Tax=Cellulomonas uda TaxID=1714 RepID=A0A4Y3KCM8_CELUD|nr:hypothetical protein CUD01_26830 [Cellulomonas uda]
MAQSLCALVIGLLVAEGTDEDSSEDLAKDEVMSMPHTVRWRGRDTDLSAQTLDTRGDSLVDVRDLDRPLGARSGYAAPAEMHPRGSSGSSGGPGGP